MVRNRHKFVATAIFFLLISFLAPRATHAQTSVADLEAKINQRNADILSLEKDIRGYQTELNTLNAQKSSLSSVIRSLDLTQKKLAADIAVTVDKIDTQNLKIQQLNSKIGTTQGKISDDTRFVKESFKEISQIGRLSLPEVLLSTGSFSGAWKAVDALVELQADLGSRINALQVAKADLEDNKRATEKAKAELVKLQSQLNSQRKVVLATQAEKNDLLKQTKNSETAYQKLLVDKQKLKDAFEKEISQYESELKLTVNMLNLPRVGTSVLAWPLDNIFVTQYFGNTPFATANPQVYKGAGHNGIDLRASIGTPLRAALSGIVVGAGNTDLYRTCASFGKWVMIAHPNGLSTLYAHLSLQTASVGQSVATGAVIGYSGNTGASTGPHLHFGVYATEGVEIKLFTNSRNCQGATIPIAAIKAYLNPLSYLPGL
ncbi:MAG: peptidoglycan DD-metalloendopeptidase family protein [Candidatus Paceibacterota bacterium]